MDDSLSLNSASVAQSGPDSTPTSLAESTSSSTDGQPTPDHRPDAKTRRYDRQLRLWGTAGQGGLETARVLLINPLASGTQALKNLILPGIGSYEILSDRQTKGEDVGQNFFLTLASLGRPLAEETARFLGELNPSVDGSAKVAAVDDLLRNDPAYFLGFSLVIAVNLPAETEDALADLLWAASDPTSAVAASNGSKPDVPLLLVRSAGYMGLVRVQLREHCIVDTHPSSLASLRIDDPFPALAAHAAAVDFSALDSMAHGNVPFVIILVRALDEWRKTHDGRAPKWSGKQSDKPAFLALLDGMRRHADEENFAEASEKAYLVAQTTALPREIDLLLESDPCVNVTKDSKPFYLLLNALRSFVNSSSNPSRLLPVSSALPDMKASTASYVALQTVYKQRAAEDLTAFRACLAETLAGVGLEADTVGESEAVEFVRNAAALKVVSGRSLRQERDEVAFNREAILSFHPDPDWNVPYVPPPIVQYVASRAADVFHATHGRYPGVGLLDADGSERAVDCAADEAVLESVAVKWLSERGWVPEAVEEGDSEMVDDEEVKPASSSLPKSVRDALGEIVRAGQSDLPTTAAFLGGVVAQEAIKLLTAQYVPLNNTAVVDMIRGSTGAYEL